MRRYMLSILLLAFLLLPPLPALASGANEETGEPVQELEEITVSATRTQRAVEEVPASVAVVGRKELEETKMFNLKEALSGIPGVLIDTKNQGYDTRLIIRGAGLKARYGVREIMVLQDGVPITDPDSLTRLDFIDTQLIERIEVVKGPNSTLWGVNAAGGVINVITRSPFGKKGGFLRLGAGDFGMENYHLSYTGNAGGNLYLVVSGSRRVSDNSWRRWNRFWTNQVSVKPSLLLDDGTTWENHISYTKASIQLPGSLSEDQFERYKETGRARETYGPWKYSGRYSEIIFLSSKLNKKIGSFDFKPMVFGNFWRHHHPVTGRINDADTDTYGADLQADMDHTFLGREGTLTAGLTARYDDQKTDYYKYAEYLTSSRGRITEVLSDKEGDHIETQKRETLLWGIYVQESIRGKRWILDVGARFDRVEFDIKGTKWAGYDWGSGRYVDCPSSKLTNCGDYRITRSYDAVSPRIALTYRIGEGLHLYGNISTGIQTPTEGEISTNPRLDLVKVRSYEVGLKARREHWRLDLALYYSPVKNEVVQVVQSDGTSDYVNAGKTDKKGMEFSGTYSPIRGLDLGLSYAYSDYTFDEFSEPVRSGSSKVNVDRSGNRLPYIPMHQYSLFARYSHPSGFRIRVETRSWGDYYMDNANTEKYGGYDFVTNLLAGYSRGNLDISVNVDNLFDRHYAMEAKKDTGGKKRYVPAPPRGFMVKLTYRF